MKRQEDFLAKFFDSLEPILFRTKFFIMIAVLVSIMVSIILIFFGVYEAFKLVVSLSHHVDAKEVQLHTLEVVDMFLFGMVMMIFAFGSYNIFISKLDNVHADIRNKQIRPKWVQIENFSELKSIFIKVVIMILIITFLELVVKNIEHFKENIYSLLIVPVGVVLIAYSLKLLHIADEIAEEDNSGYE